MKSISNVKKYLSEVKNFESSQNSKFTIMDYLLAHANTYSKFIIDINFLFVIRFPNFLLHILQQTYDIILERKYFTSSFVA